MPILPKVPKHVYITKVTKLWKSLFSSTIRQYATLHCSCKAIASASAMTISPKVRQRLLRILKFGPQLKRADLAKFVVAAQKQIERKAA